MEKRGGRMCHLTRTSNLNTILKKGFIWEEKFNHKPCLTSCTVLVSRDRVINTFYKHRTYPTVYVLSTVKYNLCRRKPQTTQTAYLLSQDGLRRSIVDPARHATFLGQVFRVPSQGNLLHIIPIQGLSLQL